MNSTTHKKIILSTVLLITSLFLLLVGIVLVAIVFTFPKLPDLDKITDYKPSMPMKIYSQDNVLIGQYGIEKRTFTKIGDFPDVLKYAVLAAEDKRFYKHKGVDTTGMLRAFISNFVSGEIGQGASTITQQVAKNFFLTNERTYKRKFYEMLLAFKIEMTLTKDQILELYFNQIYLGQKAYGFTAAAEAYFDKPVQNLTIAESAMLAGLPKAPSAFNPIVNPQRARQRQLYVLGNMLSEGWITQEKYNEAINQQLTYKEGGSDEKVNEDSLYVAEMVRRQLHDRYGDDIYRSGYRVYTTITIKNQKAATQALRRSLLSNSPKGNFRGAEAYYNLSNINPENLETTALNYLSAHHTVQGQIPAIVIEANPKKIKLLTENHKDPIVLTGASLNFISKAINNKKMGNKQVTVGSVIRLYRTKNGWSITQPPELEGSIISLDTRTGAVLAVVGGFDFFAKQFNRAIQAYRQPGSTFKPFVYSAAINKGYTTGTIVNDSPTSFGRYSPRNAGGGYSGPITIREALYRSKNVVAVKVLNSIGIGYAHKYVQRFGFKEKNISKDLTMVLGSGQATPLEMARGYAVFANGGFLVEPYVIDRIYDSRGQLIAQTKPLIAGVNAPRTIDPKNAFIMYKMLQDVIQYGTARAAQAIGRNDVGGKTGTTNDQKDAWFVGFNTRVVTAVYIGYDRPKSMGRMGYGGRIALPIWVEYMRTALRGMPVEQPKQPKNINVQNGSYSINGKTMEGVKLDSQTPAPTNNDNNQPSTNLDNLF
ncbi:PBP1A family penicillin-binding protein [Neisseriaceae bacterium PsAf]|nr:PBP1A family penicillin-binding protein [Neisseriaceae bacterium PsAf]